MAGEWPREQVKAEAKRIKAATAVSAGITFAAGDVATLREIIRFAIEQLNDTIVAAERSKDKRAIIRALIGYRDDAKRLLARIT